VKSKPKTQNPKSKPCFFIKIIIFLLGVLTFGFGISASAAELSGDEIIRRVDTNMTFDTARFESTMIIHVNDQIREKKLVSYARGRDISFTEFLSPPRDKGVKYLRIDDNMWMYLPSIAKIIKIAGHMLRQSMMGSDFSYEDALESTKLLDKYNVKLVGEEIIPITFMKGTEEVTKNRPCYILDLTAKVKEINYYRRKIWVDKEVFLPVREELFAKSGKKLKQMELGNVKEFLPVNKNQRIVSNKTRRYYPLYVSMKNLLRKDSFTEMIITKAEFDIEIPEWTFTLRNLRK
jgi:outer membrane lipoprotein-sorting protein